MFAQRKKPQTAPAAFSGASHTYAPAAEGDAYYVDLKLKFSNLSDFKAIMIQSGRLPTRGQAKSPVKTPATGKKPEAALNSGKQTASDHGSRSMMNEFGQNAPKISIKGRMPTYFSSKGDFSWCTDTYIGLRVGHSFQSSLTIIR